MKFFKERWSRPQICLPFGKIIFLCLLLVVEHMGLSLPVLAWEITTHKDLTEQTINIKAGFLNTYLIDNLGQEGGLGEVVDEKTVRQWMIEGSDFEDNLPRPLNHFHDALNNRGLESSFASGMSAIAWSLAAVGAQGGSPFSWNDAREYYFKALTSPTKAERDENWGKTFRALGQVMHLLQDSANPSHVRNDSHPDFSSYIGSLGRIDVDGLHDYMARQSVSSYPGATFFTPDPSLLEIGGAVRSEPFSNLFDRNVYTGGNPAATLGTDVGISEFTNANFFSDDTIPGQNAEAFFPFPTVFELVPAVVPLLYLTLPRLGSPTFPAARAAKLTGNEAAAQFLLTNTHFDLIGKLQLDDAVYDAQAQNLIPRAIDYSAAVLDYFFRGELDVTHQVLEVESGPLGGSTTECKEVPLEEFGLLNVEFTIPSVLNFGGDTPILYYEKSDETRVLAGATVPLAEIANPVRWYLVLKGPAGPGTQEPGAVLAETGLAEWEFFCDT